jgi:hypothetical protein
MESLFSLPVNYVGCAPREGVGCGFAKDVAHVAARNNQQLSSAHPHSVHRDKAK